MKFKERFSASDLEKIKAAVKDAEQKISGEIVPVFVERSDAYRVTYFKAALLAATATFLAIVIIDRYIPSIAIYDPFYIFVIVALGSGLGATLAYFSDFIKRMLLTPSTMDTACKQKAETLFLEEEVFNTRQRTGIMIFISFFEHEVIIMADRGINKVVDQKVWDQVVNNLINQIKMGKVIDGTIAAIIRCGEILLEKGFKKTDLDINELKDDLRIQG